MTAPDLSEAQIEVLRVMLLAERATDQGNWVRSSIRTRRPRFPLFATVEGEVADRLTALGLMEVQGKIGDRTFRLTELGRQVGGYHLDDET